MVTLVFDYNLVIIALHPISPKVFIVVKRYVVCQHQDTHYFVIFL